MKGFSRIILLALLVLTPLCSKADDDRFVKGFVQGGAMFGGAAGFEIGAGINLGKNEHWVNMQASINYSGNKHSEKKETDSNGNVIETEPSADQSGLKYNRISVPVELLVRLGGDGYKPFYIGVGAVYYQNMNGKLIYMREEQELNDGINAVNFAGRVSVGGAMKIKDSQSFGLKAYADINITPPLNKYSISDRLFEYKGPIEKSFGMATFGIAVFYTF